MTSRLRVIHCLPSAIRLDGYIVPDAFRSCAESRSNEALTDQNATLSAIDMAKSRISLLLSLILLMHDLHRIPNYSTCDDSLLTSLRVSKTDPAARRSRLTP